MARVCSHACESWRSRAAAWSCRARGTGIPGPWHDAVAVRRWQQQGRWWRVGLLHKSATKAKRGEVVLALDYGGFFGNADIKGWGKKETTATALTESSLAGLLARWQDGAGGSGPCRVSGCVEVVVRGAGLAKLQGGDSLLLLAQLDVLHLLALLLLLLF
jgi:hypothetical protein